MVELVMGIMHKSVFIVSDRFVLLLLYPMVKATQYLVFLFVVVDVSVHCAILF